MRPTIAEINLSNLKFNYLNIRKQCKTKVMAVVKADAYGHGMIECVKKLSSLGEMKPEYYGVALTEEAIELRKAKVIKEPILIFAPFTKGEEGDYLKYNIMPTVSTDNHLKLLKKVSGSKKIKVHVNIDTGMGRVGVNHSDAVKFIKELAKLSNIKIDGIYTHFATSDEQDKDYANLQLKRFSDVVNDLKSEGIDYGLAHCSNSGAVLDMPDARFDMVRPGIALYGYYPSLETTESIKLKPVMSIYSKITTIRKVAKGESVSYGRRFTAERDTLAATVPMGYADGFVRNLTNKTKAVINGEFCNQIGQVTMDRILYDVTNSSAKIGQKVVILGKTKDKQIDAWNWSEILNTIPYEITCNISKRVPRVYK